MRKNRASDNKSRKYSFRLTEEQHIRFERMLCLEHNRSRFIVGRIFDETFRVVRADPTKQRYIVRLNEYIAQISRVGNNYNQVVKAINTYLSRNMLPRQIDTLVAYTRELKALSEQVLELTKRLREEWLKE